MGIALEMEQAVIPVASRVTEAYEYINEAELSYFLSWAKPLHGKVLDVAASSGHVACEIAPYVDRVVALDFRRDMMNRIVQHAMERSLTNIDAMLSFSDRLSFQSASFDGVICRGIAHHISELGLFLSEIARVLKPGGWFLLEDIVGPGQFSFTDELDEVEKVRDPSHVHFYSPEAWTIIIEKAGLEQKRQEVAPKPYNLGELFKKANVSILDRSFLLEKMFASQGWLREYLRPHGDGDSLTVHYHKMLLYAIKPVEAIQKRSV